MTNLEAAIDVLCRHRAGRQWTDEAVAADLLAQLGIDPAGLPVVTEEKAAAAESAARELLAKAQAAANHARDSRMALAAQQTAAPVEEVPEVAPVEVPVVEMAATPVEPAEPDLAVPVEPADHAPATEA